METLLSAFINKEGKTQMKKAIYPGSFDPITNGHLDIIDRAANIFDELVIAVLINPEKKGLFNFEERIELIKKSTKNYKNIKIVSFENLLIDYMRANDIQIVIKGLRAVSDFEYEYQMALMNTKLAPETETLFMMTKAEYSFLSSSSVKNVAMFGGCIKDLVPNPIMNDIIDKIKKNRR